MLYGSCIQGLAYASQSSLPLGAIVACDSDLDQLVSFEADVDLLHYGVGQAFVADLDNRGEAMCASFEGLALKRGEWNGHEGLGKSGILG